MANLEKLMQVNVPTWPFRIMNRCIIPLVIIGGGSWRVWQTAQTPFEEFAGVLLVMAAALLWAIGFGSGLDPHQPRRTDTLDQA